MRAAVFLDRDGVINHNRDDYVKSWQEFVFLPGVFTPLRRLAESGLVIVVVSNQSAVGRGLVSRADVEMIHRLMIEEIEQQGGRVDGVYYCAHHPDERCDCRKPRPGLLLSAAADLHLDLRHSFMVGDAQSDLVTALNAGCQPLLVLTGRGQRQLRGVPPRLLEHCQVVPDLGAAVSWILHKHHSRMTDWPKESVR